MDMLPKGRSLLDDIVPAVAYNRKSGKSVVNRVKKTKYFGQELVR